MVIAMLPQFDTMSAWCWMFKSLQGCDSVFGEYNITAGNSHNMVFFMA
jgi:hypothetical protein